MVPSAYGTAVMNPVCMMVKPSCLMISAVNTAMPTLTPACAKWIAAIASTCGLTSVFSTETLPIASTTRRSLSITAVSQPLSSVFSQRASRRAGRSSRTTRQCP